MCTCCIQGILSQAEVALHIGPVDGSALGVDPSDQQKSRIQNNSHVACLVYASRAICSQCQWPHVDNAKGRASLKERERCLSECLFTLSIQSCRIAYAVALPLVHSTSREHSPNVLHTNKEQTRKIKSRFIRKKKLMAIFHFLYNPTLHLFSRASLRFHFLLHFVIRLKSNSILNGV